MPLISIIVPVYNVEKYLRTCVNSILSQTISDFELILVDDGSPDCCPHICDEYDSQDDRIRVIHQSNMGLSGARNTGIEAAQGMYITFIDSDDFISPNYLESLLELITKYDADISLVDNLRVGEDSNISSIFITDDNEKVEEYSCTGREFCQDLYDESTIRKAVSPITACGKLFKLSLFGDLRFPVGRIHEDVYFTPQISYRASKVAISNKKLYYYRVVPGSISQASFSLKKYDHIWGMEQCINYFSIMNEKEIVKKAQKKRDYFIALYSIHARINDVTIPKEYIRSLIFIIYHLRTLPDEKFQWYLSQYSKRLALLYEYYLKIRKLFYQKN